MALANHSQSDNHPASDLEPPKSLGFISFFHRRHPSSGHALPPRPDAQPVQAFDSSAIMTNNLTRSRLGALSERQQNRIDHESRSPTSVREHGGAEAPVRGCHARDSKVWDSQYATRSAAASGSSPTKPKKTKSGTNLVGLLYKPKSLKNLYKMATEEHQKTPRDKENRSPCESVSPEVRTPIFAQFTASPAAAQSGAWTPKSSTNLADRREHLELKTSRDRTEHSPPPPQLHVGGKRMPDKNGKGAVLSIVTTHTHCRSKSAASSPTKERFEKLFSPEELEKQLEDLLNRRNIPENQRYKMRNLSDTIKMEFIRQDWAETQAARLQRSETLNTSKSDDHSAHVLSSSDGEEDKRKHSRGRSFTFSRAKKDSRSSSKKSKREASLGRHFRGKSTDSVAIDEPLSATSFGSSSFLSKMKLQQGPGDYVTYLRKVQKPELVEVGKLHKLRLLLRNETVAWIEAFISQGGMMEIVGLLNRIMEVEWREEHEDALLHEDLLCLKALSTTARAMEYLHSVEADLSPKLLHLLFDPEKKGPSEFTTRNIITSVLLTYIESAAPVERSSRAHKVLLHLRDREPKEEERPLPFVREMRQERPYRVWCKEVVSVTKEVFWIFLHHLNVIAVEEAKEPHLASEGLPEGTEPEAKYAYMHRHFPPERPPVPAAPYVGGVEWDATNYLASHLDLMNAILACTLAKDERNELRGDFRISGWERCFGGSLRLCKEKFYGAVHMALRTWVAAAAEDGWEVREVRFGPAQDARGSPKKAAGGGLVSVAEPAPKLDMPKLELGLEQPKAGKDAWLT